MRRRRVAEGLAVAVLVPLTLWLGWRDAAEVQARQWEAPTSESSVPAGGTGVLAHARWRLLSLAPGKREGRQVEMKGTLQVTPLDATGIKEIGSVTYAIEDAAGHRWVGYYLGDVQPKRPGQTIERPFTAQIHDSALGSARLALEWDEQNANWVRRMHHVLKFAGTPSPSSSGN
jgi:hypothetical protein